MEGDKYYEVNKMHSKCLFELSMKPNTRVVY
jgi:hypothetical protein